MPEPAISDHDVLVEVQRAAVNPIDHRAATTIPNVKPMPHIPGAEFAGTITKTGAHVDNVKVGDRVTVYNRVFDGTCDMCIGAREMLCRNGGIIGVVTDGGHAEYARVPANCVFPIPEHLGWEMAASLPVAALTSYHALLEAELKPNETLVVFGASGNTGLFAVQFGRRFGASVVAVSDSGWVKDYGADHVVPRVDAVERVRELTGGKMANVVLNSLGSATWQTAFDTVGLGGRLVLFGVLTGSKAEVALDRVYNRQIRIVGSTGGTRRELAQLISVAKELRLKVWRRFKLDDAVEAYNSLFSKQRQGRVLIKP